MIETQPASAAVDNMNVIDLLIVLARRKRDIAVGTIGATVIGVVVALCLPSIYTSTTTLLPPVQNQTALSMMVGQFGPLAAAAGKEVGLRNQSDVFVAMLQSRTVGDALVKRFDLQQAYRIPSLDDARTVLASMSEIVAAKNGTISISVRDRDRGRAANLANAYVEELQTVSQNLAVTEAGQRRLFFERQMQTTRDRLADAEAALKRSQETTGLVSLDDQGKAIIESVANVQAQITAHEVQLRAMKAFATDQNPDFVRVEQELQGLRAHLAQMQNGKIAGHGDLQVPTGKVPEAGLDYARKLREVRYQETVFELLARQFEAAKIDEAKDAAIIQVLDKAVPAERRSSPRRQIIVLLSAVAGFLLSCSWIAATQVYEQATSTPEQMARIALLKSHLKFRL